MVFCDDCDSRFVIRNWSIAISFLCWFVAGVAIVELPEPVHDTLGKRNGVTMKMISFFIPATLLACGFLGVSPNALFAVDNEDLTQYVDPQIDTYNSRWFYFSSACRPFGMVNLAPIRRRREVGNQAISTMTIPSAALAMSTLGKCREFPSCQRRGR